VQGGTVAEEVVGVGVQGVTRVPRLADQNRVDAFQIHLNVRTACAVRIAFAVRTAFAVRIAFTLRIAFAVRIDFSVGIEFAVGIGPPQVSN